MIIKLFASLKEKYGSNKIVIEKDNLKNIYDLKKYLEENYNLDVNNCMFACNLEYVDEKFLLESEHEISIIPPVSGGDSNDVIEIIEDEIVPENYKSKITTYNGAELTFLGISRDTNDGKKVLSLFYECFEEMAISEIRKLTISLKNKYSIDYFKVIHRIGEVPPGELSLLVKIASEHRKQSLECMTEFLDAFKEKVPIWKKENYKDGSNWLWYKFIK